MEKVYVKKSKIAGRGIFAQKDFKKNEIIFVAKGEIKEKNYGSYYKFGSHWMAIGKCKWINPPKNNPLYFTNHSCLPNAGLKGKMTIVAMRNIRKDEEIIIDYSTTEDDPYWKMRCGCRAKNCRKIIRSVRFLPKNLFKKYKPFIPKWLQYSYLRANKNKNKR